jgi:LPXTG-motif cell wall-anchored protein
MHTYSTAGTYVVGLTETSSGGTSTTRVFTGQTVLRNGGPQAVAGGSVEIPAATGGTTTTTSGGGTTTPVTLPPTGPGAANATLVTVALLLLALGVAFVVRSRRHPA